MFVTNEIDEDRVKLLHCDNLQFVKTYTGEPMDLIYIDPPFNSKRDYKNSNGVVEFTDTWSNVGFEEELEALQELCSPLGVLLNTLDLDPAQRSYLTHMAIRCYYMRLMLRDTGSFYYHCDPTMSHYIKVVLDYIFGRENFRNEIVWFYGGGCSPSKDFARKHDIVFRYGKTQDITFNLDSIARENPEAARYKHEDEKGKYRWHVASKQDYKIYLKPMNERDVWELGYVKSNYPEYIGYPTQKPLALLERIIKASTNEGDLVADFFLGGGTTAEAAYTLGRRFLGCDINYRAIQITKERLNKLTEEYLHESKSP